MIAAPRLAPLAPMFRRIGALCLALFALCVALPAAAQVTASFQSFNGSALFGRYPHTFVVLEGTLADGTPVNENYGFSAKMVSPAILTGPVDHVVMSEKQKYVDSTNRHFTVPVSDAKYREIVVEVAAWRDHPGKFYDLGSNNCIHFVGRIAQMVGLTVDYPKDMLRKPKAWLNRVTELNPQLGAQPIR